MSRNKERAIKKENKLKFIDLFAGLGGFHLALEELGHECVFASELSPDLQKLYSVNFPDTPIYGDITKIPLETIPSHNILCGGFPCQPFSTAGSGLGEMDIRGTLFYEIIRICKDKQPQNILLVSAPKNLRN